MWRPQSAVASLYVIEDSPQKTAHVQLSLISRGKADLISAKNKSVLQPLLQSWTCKTWVFEAAAALKGWLVRSVVRAFFVYAV